jgi:hypothetical protein
VAPARVAAPTPSTPSARPRLDRATLTVSCFPTCGEATISRGVAEPSSVQLARAIGKRGEALDPEASERSSLARTRRQVRRWCTHHRATRLATLTFATEPADLDAGWLAIEQFRRRLDDAGIAQPLIVPEWGSQNGRLHFHAALPKYVPKEQLAKLWGHGFVDVRRLRPRGGPGRPAQSARSMARICAGYVAGYVSKGAGGASTHAGPGMNRRRYSIPKATVPQPVRFSCIGDLFDAWTEVQAMCGHRLEQVWSSASDDQWRGPPTLLLMG